MMKGSQANEPVEIDEALAWRESLALRLIRAFFGIFVLSALLVAVSIDGSRERARMIFLSLAGILWFAVPAITGRPRGKARGWVIVLAVHAAALAGYATLGFLSGPGVSLAISLMLAGFLLGARAMIGLGVVSMLVLSTIAWGMVHGWLRPPNPQDISATNPLAWVRSLGVSFLGAGLFGGLMVSVIARMERALRQLRVETLRRQQAERARAEAELLALESKQMEVVGQLAAGIAHDFNNNLTAIIGCAELLKQELPDRPDALEITDEILHSSKRAAELTRQLLVYSRKAQMVLVPSDLHAMIEAAVALARRSMGPNIAIKTELNASHPYVLADKALFEGAVLNLLVNARDAMPSGGTLLISTVAREGERGKGADRSPRRGVLLEVTDTGSGIPEQMLPQIFDPFFTTKPVGKGTGLGLAAVSGTVKAHGGTITVESKVSVGTTFRIWLPSAPRETSAHTASGNTIVRGKGQILLVDDDSIVASAAIRTLEALGYTVTHVADGQRALEVVAEDVQRFRLVLLDLRMPGLSGEATFARLKEIAPDLRVLLWSGYRAGQDVDGMLKRGAAGFVHKPYTIAQLSQAVAAALRSD